MIPEFQKIERNSGIVYLYFSGLDMFPKQGIDPTRWKLLSGVESSLDFKRYQLRMLPIPINDPSFLTMANHPDTAAIIFLGFSKNEKVDALHECKKPIFFSIYSSITGLESLLAYDNVFYLKENYSKACAEIAWHLLESGHEKIFYTKSYLSHEWEKEREIALRAAFKAYDASIVFNSYQFNPQISANASHQTQKMLERFQGRVSERYPELEHFRSFGVFNQNVNENVKLCVRDHVALEIEEKQFETALKQGASVWICSHDQVAIRAQRFLKKRGKTIPDSISLIGFDNDNSTNLRFTSYDFGYMIGGMIVTQLITNPSLRTRSDARIIHLPGYLVDRHTVSKITRKSLDKALQSRPSNLL